MKDRVKETCDKGDAFWKDMDEEEVKMEFGILIDYFAKEQKFQRLQDLNHISEQWNSLMGPKIKAVPPCARTLPLLGDEKIRRLQGTGIKISSLPWESL